MNYPNIIAKVYAGVWAIQPRVHDSICAALESRMNGTRADMGGFIEAPEEKDGPYELAGTAAIIDVCGILGKHLSFMETECGGCDVDEIGDALATAIDDPRVESILFNINSPGGVVTGIPELAQAIRACEKPTAAFCDDICASAAYWLASQCDAIYTTGSATVGSVGVYSIYLDESRALENDGVKVNAISAGKYKLLGASFKPMEDDERAMLQADVDAIKAEFSDAVKSMRDVPDDCLEGQCFSGKQAVENGMSDGLVGSIAEVFTLL